MRYAIADSHYRLLIAFAAGFALTPGLGTNAFAQLLSGSRVNIEPRVVVPKARADIRVDSNLVLVPVTVVDRKSRFVTGLDREYFRIFEDEQEQAISHFAIEDAPVSVCIVFDRSDSMESKMKSAREAVAQFLKSAGPEDEFSLITFSSGSELSLSFTDSTERIQKRLAATEASGNTALIDAVYLGLRHIKTARNSRKAILIVSDGGDNASRFSIGELKRNVRESDAQIFAVALYGHGVLMPSLFEEGFGAGLLVDISSETGGQMFRAESLRDLPKIAAKIGSALRTQYVLGFVPPAGIKDGRFHRVKVELARSVSKQKLRLSWRRGYYAPSE